MTQLPSAWIAAVRGQRPLEMDGRSNQCRLMTTKLTLHFGEPNARRFAVMVS